MYVGEEVTALGLKIRGREGRRGRKKEGEDMQEEELRGKEDYGA